MGDTRSRDILDYFEILARNRWRILLPALALAAVAGSLAFLIPPRWEVDAIIQPSKFFVEKDTGEFVESFVAEPKLVADLISRETYNLEIARELRLDVRRLPKIRAENLREARLVRVAVRGRRIEQGQRILALLIEHLKADLDRKTTAELKGVENRIVTQRNLIDLKKLAAEDIRLAITTKEQEIRGKRIDIRLLEIEKKRIGEKIVAEKTRRAISEERQKNLVGEMAEVKTRIEGIDRQQKQVLENPARTEAVGLLLYANEIQQSYRYHGTLDEKLSAEKIAMENARLAVRELEEDLAGQDQAIEKLKTEIAILTTEADEKRNEILKTETEIKEIDNQILLLDGRKARIEPTAFLKPPTPSPRPVFPRKAPSVILGFLLGLFAATAAVGLRDYAARAGERRRLSPPPGR